MMKAVFAPASTAVPAVTARRTARRRFVGRAGGERSVHRARPARELRLELDETGFHDPRRWRRAEGSYFAAPGEDRLSITLLLDTNSPWLDYLRTEKNAAIDSLSALWAAPNRRL